MQEARELEHKRQGERCDDGELTQTFIGMTMIFERKIKDFEGKNEDLRTKYELERNFNRFLKGR